ASTSLVFLGKGIFSSGRGWIGCLESGRLCSGLFHEVVVVVSEQVILMDVAESFIFWTLGDGSVFFWHDNWLGEKPLAQLLHRDDYTMEPPTISIFLWQFFHDRIPVDAKMKHKGFSFPSKLFHPVSLGLAHLDTITILDPVVYIDATECCKTVPRAPSIVGWHTPSPSWFKLNTDSSSFGNPGLARAGGIIRDLDGHVHLAYHVALGTGTSVIAELTAVWRDLELAMAHGLAPLVVEVDALAMLVSDIRHVFREANGAADHLAKEAASLQLTQVLRHGDITGVLRGILNLDTRDVPHLRWGR
ncbi:UNVERIFIED_CONTAM: putative ribonuclease H protein, partial [Sesamum radiatum]